MHPLIALEEHYLSPAFENSSKQGPMYARFNPTLLANLRDLGTTRLTNLDKGKITLQVISHAAGLGQTPAEARSANDYLAAAVKENPERYAAFATLPVVDPEAAARELERCVKELGCLGALVENHAPDGRYLDDKSFWPIWEMAEKLDTVIYVHPTYPSPSMAQRYQGDWPKSVETALGAAAWGWHADTGLSTIRLFAAGIFDRYPKLKYVIGHMGEMLPFQLERILRLERRGVLGDHQRGLREVWDTNIWITTSGMFSLNPMACMLRNTKHDRILYSVDYPFAMNEEGLEFVEALEKSGMVTEEEFKNICYENAERLLKIKATS